MDNMCHLTFNTHQRQQRHPVFIPSVVSFPDPNLKRFHLSFFAIIIIGKWDCENRLKILTRLARSNFSLKEVQPISTTVLEISMPDKDKFTT